MEQGWGFLHKEPVLLGSQEIERPNCLLHVSFTNERKGVKDQGVRRETLGVGGWLGVDLRSNWQARVCVVEMEKRDIAEGCRKYDGDGWGEGGSSHLESLLEEVRKKCKESSGKGI